MIRYKFVKGIVKENNTAYQLAKKYNWKLTITHIIGKHYKYRISHNLFCIFSTNDKYALRMWLDLNGKKTVGKAYIFRNKMKNGKDFCVIGLTDR